MTSNCGAMKKYAQTKVRMSAFDFRYERVGGIGGFSDLNTRWGSGGTGGQADRQLRFVTVSLFYLDRLPNASRKCWRFVKTR